MGFLLLDLEFIPPGGCIEGSPTGLLKTPGVHIGEKKDITDFTVERVYVVLICTPAQL